MRMTEWAAQVNFRLAIAQPEVYLDYAPLAHSEWYRQFILGTFARHITPLVETIAVGQLLIGVLISHRGIWVRLGLVGAIVFLVAIVPLGTGSGFPATLIMALAAAVLFRAAYPETLWRVLVVRTSARFHRRADSQASARGGGRD